MAGAPASSRHGRSAGFQAGILNQVIIMLVADVIMWFLVIVGVCVAFPALWLLSRGLYPRQVENIADYLDKSLVKPFFMGLPIAAAGFFIVAVLGGKKSPFMDIAAFLTLGAILFYANIGVAGLATMIGRRLPSPSDAERAWKGTLRGGTVLVLSFVFPFLGWFCILPFSLIIGAGALTSRLIAGRRSGGGFIVKPNKIEAESAKTNVAHAGADETVRMTS